MFFALLSGLGGIYMEQQATRILGRATALSTLTVEEVDQVTGGIPWQGITWNESLSNPEGHGSGEITWEMDDCGA